MPSASDRIAITGIGAWTPYGPGWSALTDGLAAGRRALTPVDPRAPALAGAVAGLIHDLAPFRAAFPEVRPPLPIAPTQHCLLAARHALADADLLGDPEREAIGVYLGRNRGPAGVVARIMEPVLAGGPKKTSPLLFSQSVANAPLGAVAAHLVLRGPSLMTQGGGLLPLALDALRRGDAPALLVGGFEEVEAHCLAADAANRFIDPFVAPDAIRPYRPESRGPTFGEGAVFLVLEPLTRARARRAPIYAELLAAEAGLGEPPAGVAALAGWGSPTPAGLAALARQALAAAARAPADLDLHSGGGNGLPRLDAVERGALALLGRPDLPSHTLKAHLGEGLGMGALLAVAYAADALRRGAPRLPGEPAPASSPAPEPAPPPPRLALVTHLEFHGALLAALLAAPPT